MSVGVRSRSFLLMILHVTVKVLVSLAMTWDVSAGDGPSAQTHAAGSADVIMDVNVSVRINFTGITSAYFSMAASVAFSLSCL